MAASLALLLLLTLRSVLQQWRADSMQRVRNTANLLALSSQEALQRGDVIALDQLLRELMRDPRLERVIVADPSGTPISDSTPDKPTPALLQETPTLGESYRIVVDGASSQVLVPIARLGTPMGAVFVRFSLREHQATEHRMLQRGLAIGILALAVSAALVIGFSSILSSPLQRLAASMDYVASGGLEERVPESNWLELHQMASSFNHMTEALGYRMRDLQSLTHLGLVVSRSLTLSEVMDSTVRRIEGAFPDSRVQIWLPNRRPGTMVLAADSVGAAETGTRLETSSFPILAHAMRTGKPGVTTEAGQQMPSDPAFAARFAAGTVIAAPLTTGAEANGALVMLASGREHALENRLGFLTIAAQQVALALDNARLFNEEVRISRIFQRALRPEPSQEPRRLQLAVEWRPAPGPLEVAGDFHDLLALPDARWLIAVGDVCGHGLVAATYTAMAKYVLRAYAYESRSPAEILQRTNLAVYRQLEAGDPEETPAFITVLCAIYDPETGRLLYAHAGHPLGVIARADGSGPLCLDKGGPALGLMADAVYEEGEVLLRPEDILALYTDGVMEAARGGELLESDRIAALLAAHQHESATAALDAVLGEVARLSQGKQYDDLTLLVFRVCDDAALDSSPIPEA